MPLFLVLAYLFIAPLAASAASTEPTITAAVAKTTSTNAKNGFVTEDEKTYYYKNNKKLKGFQEIDGKTYYFDKQGVMLTGFQKINGKTYYFNKNGVMRTGLRKINKKYYYFNKNGVMKTGFQTIKSKKYYFNSKGVMQTGFQTIKKKTYYFNSSGVMQTGKKKINSKYYYFNKSGVMQTGFQTISKKKYYFNSKGVMVTGLNKIKKKYYYFNKSGVMQTGFVEIKGVTYYFDSKTGAKYMPSKNGTVKKIDSTYAVFNKDGALQKESSYVVVKGTKMQVQYYSDPQVSTEKLLAAIIYAEAGNQKNYPVKGKLNGKTITLYKGHLAVGYVIANRMTSSMGMKEVIYQQYQFEPSRTGVLTRYLENYSLVSTDCKNAAKVILYDLKNNTNSVSSFKRSDFTWKNFWAVSYAKTTRFYSVYTTKEYYTLQGHVFFNYTKSL